MIDRSEYDNLKIMLQKGLINEKTYQCHKNAILEKQKQLKYTNLTLIDLNKFSILKALKFSFSKISFISTFFFLFIAATILVIVFRLTWNNPECFSKLVSFFNNTKEQNRTIFYIINSLLYSFWQSIWFCLFSYFSFNSLKQIYGVFSYKYFFIKSFFLLIITSFWSISMVSLWASFIIHVLHQKPELTDLTNLNGIQILFSIVYIIAAIIISYIFTNLTMMLTGPLKTRLLEKSFFKGLKKPSFFIKFWFGVLINIFVISGVLYFTNKFIFPLIANIHSFILEANSSFSLSSIIIFILIYWTIYVVIPRKHIVWIYASFLFFIPSCIVYSMFTNIFSFRFIFLFFLIMQLIWFYLYIVVFFTIQSIAFWNHLLTQMWCCLMNGEYISLKKSSQNKNIYP